MSRMFGDRVVFVSFFKESGEFLAVFIDDALVVWLVTTLGH